MLPDGPRRLTLRIAGSQIASIGGSPHPGDRVIDLHGYAVFPGLVNAFDQLDLNVYPRVKLRDRYDHAREWHHDITEQIAATPSLAQLTAIPVDRRLFIGGLKNLLSGATTVLHHGEPLRAARARGFPVHAVERYGWAHSLFEEADVIRSYDRTPIGAPWIIRLAEGFDQTASRELEALKKAGCLERNTVVVHGVGFSEGDVQAISAAGAGLIWCPETNRFLLGKTRYHAALTGRIALGTGPRLTGSLDLLEEMKLAAYLSGLPDRRIVQMVTLDAAQLLRLPDRGRLRGDAPADLILIANRNRDPYEVLMESHRSDLKMVMTQGKPRIAGSELASLFELTRTAYEAVKLDGIPRLLARDLANRLRKGGISEPGLELR